MKKSTAKKLEAFNITPNANSGIGETLELDRHQSLTSLPLTRIRPNPNQPRRHSSKEKLDQLIHSIRERGLLQPIRVREIKTNAEYEIIAGERRWRAAQEVGLSEIPAVIVREQAPEQAYIDALVENVVREDLNPIDRAEALVQIRFRLGGKSWQEIATASHIGLKKTQIYDLLGLRSLPDPVQQDIRSGALTEKHGRALRPLRKDPPLLEKAWKHMKHKKLSGDDALGYTQSLKDQATARRVFTVSYRTDHELIQALQGKLRELKKNKPPNQPRHGH